MNYSQFKQLFDRLQRTNTRYTDVMKITRLDGTIFRFTSNDETVTIRGEGDFIPANSFEITALEMEQGFAVTNADFTTLIDSDLITESDLKNGLFDDAQVELSVAYWTAGASGLLPLKFGWMGDVTVDNVSFKAEFRGIADRLAQVFTKTLQIGCRSPFGQGPLGVGQCFADLTTLTHNHTIDTVMSNDIFTLTVGTGATDHKYKWGLIKFLTGNNAGYDMEVIQHDDNTIGLFLPMDFDVTPGDTVQIVEGCDHTTTKCRIFGQILNYDGEPYITGSDLLQQYPDSHM